MLKKIDKILDLVIEYFIKLNFNKKKDGFKNISDAVGIYNK